MLGARLVNVPGLDALGSLLTSRLRCSRMPRLIGRAARGQSALESSSPTIAALGFESRAVTTGPIRRATPGFI